jgi:hypothetical protein
MVVTNQFCLVTGRSTLPSGNLTILGRFHCSPSRCSPSPFRVRMSGLPADMSTSPIGLVPVSSAPRQRKPYGADRPYRQPAPLLYAPGGPFIQFINSQKSDADRTTDGHARLGHNHPDNIIYVTSFENSESSYSYRARRKKENQWKNWTEVTIPSLLKPYLSILRNSDTFRYPQAEVSFTCSCGGVNGRNLWVSCIYFDSQSHPSS